MTITKITFAPGFPNIAEMFQEPKPEPTPTLSEADIRKIVQEELSKQSRPGNSVMQVGKEEVKSPETKAKELYVVSVSAYPEDQLAIPSKFLVDEDNYVGMAPTLEMNHTLVGSARPWYYCFGTGLVIKYYVFSSQQTAERFINCVVNFKP